jgi:hypothetical protein
MLKIDGFDSGARMVTKTVYFKLFVSLLCFRFAHETAGLYLLSIFKHSCYIQNLSVKLLVKRYMRIWQIYKNAD